MSVYITIKEFAEKAGVSQQAIYKQVERKLKNYVKLVDNQKMIDIKALQEVYGIEVEQPLQPNTQPVEQPIQSANQQIIDRLLFDMLQEELQKKNEQIETLQQIIKENELKHHESLMQSQQNLEREQQLHLLSKQRILELESKQTEESMQEQKERKGFWSRLFRW